MNRFKYYTLFWEKMFEFHETNINNNLFPQFALKVSHYTRHDLFFFLSY